MGIIAYSGKKGSGKDLCGMITQALLDKPTSFDGMTEITEEDVMYKVWDNPKYKNKKFADKLKDIVCLLLGCTRTQLEDRVFKETQLGEEWNIYKVHDGSVFRRCTKEFYDNLDNNLKNSFYTFIEYLTPRKLLQLIGTECGREIIHPNIWVNSLFADYIGDNVFTPDIENGMSEEQNLVFPDWVITDMRFPNELEKVVENHGITIRVYRNWYFEQTEDNYIWFNEKDKSGNLIKVSTKYTLPEAKKIYLSQLAEISHESETALDNAEFKHLISNNGTIVELVQKIKKILIDENLIKV